VLVSGGVGITPMMAIAEHIVEEGRRSGKYRPIHFIHGAQNGRVRAFGNRIQELASEHPAKRARLLQQSVARGSDRRYV
jgi:ferredoxin-NADP reductase